VSRCACSASRTRGSSLRRAALALRIGLFFVVISLSSSSGMITLVSPTVGETSVVDTSFPVSVEVASMPPACQTPLTPEQQSLGDRWRWLPAHLFRRLRYRRDVTLLGKDDAVAAGVEAVIRAARTFNPALGFTFATYAWRPVGVAIIRAAQRWA